MAFSPEVFLTREFSNAVLLPATQEDYSASDPLLNAFELPLQRVFCPRGFPVRLQTNSQEVLDAAHESWGETTQLFTVPEIRIQVGVLPADSPHAFPVPVWRSRENLISSVADAQNFSICDVSQGFGFCWLSDRTVANHAYLRYHFLEAAALSLVTAKYLTPIHGACVAWRGRGVLLCGDSGAGKSSLSFACARSGWDFLSDDATCLLRGREGRVAIGNPEHLHFRDSALGLFPELQHIPLRPRINGDISIEIATAACPEITTAREAQIDFVLFLNRDPNSGSPSVEPFPADRALNHFSQALSFGEKQQLEEQRRSLKTLLSAKVLEFRYSDLTSGVEFLRRLVEGNS